jgi:phosphatidylglycerophosphatase C
MADVAAFDFDGTLTDGGSVLGFLAAVAGRRTALSAVMALAPQLAHGALVGGVVADRTKEDLFERVLAGVSVASVEAVADRYGREHLAKHLRSRARDRFEWHRGRGDLVVIVSASPEVYVKVAGEGLGADGVVATRLEVGGGQTLTGRYDGANCRGDEKLRRLRQWIGESGVAPEALWAYGNSRGDLKMLRAADVGVNVGRLGRLGRLRSFPALGPTPPADAARRGATEPPA